MGTARRICSMKNGSVVVMSHLYCASWTLRQICCYFLSDQSGRYRSGRLPPCSARLQHNRDRHDLHHGARTNSSGRGSDKGWQQQEEEGRTGCPCCSGGGTGDAQQRAAAEGEQAAQEGLARLVVLVLRPRVPGRQGPPHAPEEQALPMPALPASPEHGRRSRRSH